MKGDEGLELKLRSEVTRVTQGEEQGVHLSFRLMMKLLRKEGYMAGSLDTSASATIWLKRRCTPVSRQLNFTPFYIFYPGTGVRDPAGLWSELCRVPD